ncbi:N-acetylmannosamine-6-phosphate 2-epimerase [Pseudogracilibacillus auburnensis]|uniref:Putative N-acetylmannosamine-6-phosphate 2-epimerase n=1 Tax=Pseudogracilibacillus auburnensis TaxID=1494959 RepID=A0A2V3W7U1_9BACI|nr:N-acetylmannosamine-6-phosphate 2-epimerase [Pseudogracilibacillus auburnensis]PXW90100.1 N-acylglucosamine-6-phosphate 2-epimerase [Pseudogracilibacillus auburnensis]
MKNDIIASLKNKLIVSCQAYEGDPLFGGDTMAKMAIAAEQGGAGGIRTNGFEDIVSIRKVTDLPIIGIMKEYYSGYDVYITPTYKELDVLEKTDADIIALDCTMRDRPDQSNVSDLIKYIKHDLGKLVMADVATLEEGIFAAENGADLIGTTLSGYTNDTKGIMEPDWDLIKDLANVIDVPIIAEGRINTGEQAAKALKLGAHAVCIGTAITRPEVITENIVRKMTQ